MLVTMVGFDQKSVFRQEVVLFKLLYLSTASLQVKMSPIVVVMPTKEFDAGKNLRSSLCAMLYFAVYHRCFLSFNLQLP